MNRAYTVFFTSPAEIRVDVVAEDEDEASELAYEQARELTNMSWTDGRGASAVMSIDGIAGEVEEA